MYYTIRDTLSNTVSDKLKFLNLIYPDLIKNVFNHKTIKYTIESLSFCKHKKIAVTTAIKTMARCGYLSQSFLLNL